MNKLIILISILLSCGIWSIANAHQAESKSYTSTRIDKGSYKHFDGICYIREAGVKTKEVELGFFSPHLHLSNLKFNLYKNDRLILKNAKFKTSIHGNLIFQKFILKDKMTVSRFDKMKVEIVFVSAK